MGILVYVLNAKCFDGGLNVSALNIVHFRCLKASVTQHLLIGEISGQGFTL